MYVRAQLCFFRHAQQYVLYYSRRASANILLYYSRLQKGVTTSVRDGDTVANEKIRLQSTEGCDHVSTQQIYTRCKTSMTAVKPARCNHRSLLQSRSLDNKLRMDSNIAR